MYTNVCFETPLNWVVTDCAHPIRPHWMAPSSLLLLQLLPRLLQRPFRPDKMRTSGGMSPRSLQHSRSVRSDHRRVYRTCSSPVGGRFSAVTSAVSSTWCGDSGTTFWSGPRSDLAVATGPGVYWRSGICRAWIRIPIGPVAWRCTPGAACDRRPTYARRVCCRRTVGSSSRRRRRCC